VPGQHCLLAEGDIGAPIYWRTEAFLRQYIGAPRPPCANILALRCPPSANSISISIICQAFSPVVQIGTPQPLNPQVSVSPPLVPGGDTLAGEGVGGGPNMRGQTLWYSRYHVTSFKSPIGGPNIKNLKKRRTEHFSAPRLFSSRSPINWALQTGNGNAWK
jgi:hypothetical protein